MSNHTKLLKSDIIKQYILIKKYYNKYLKKYGVVLPKLYDKNKKFTKNALVLVYLSIDYPKTKKVSKTEITQFVRDFYPNVNDVQQPRHLGAQDGWWIIAGGRDNIVINIQRGYYHLYTLERPYPSFKKAHRVSDTSNWKKIKAHYSYRCATCGSREGEPHFHWPGTKTKLEKSHKDPNKPLIAGNIIPQCQKCNRADRNRWVYDDKGRVIKLAKPSFVKNFDKDVRLKIYKILYNEFKGINPNKKNEKKRKK
ncbi:hypothetical protein AMJ49_06610 [Parcubacteria bacterium DG_74_2]|nr:MAG: hypothetical protein AMJ49_06610 [Parcubacteria bacterium DG_74_2]